MGSHLECGKSKWLCSAYVGSPECRAEGGASHLLRATPSIPSGVITRRGSTLRLSRGEPRRARGSKAARGAARSVLNLRPPIRRDCGRQYWCSSGFANTDLDLLHKKHGIDKLIVIGLITYTCVEATVRYAAELGCDVSVTKDATADYSDEHMHAALAVNLPSYAGAIVTANEVVESISSVFPYSERSASVTSTRAARSAGNIDAMIAAANSTPTDTTSGNAVGICKSGK